MPGCGRSIVANLALSMAEGVRNTCKLPNPSCAQVAATKCRRFAKSVFEDLGPSLGGGCSARLKKAGNVDHLSNAERDLHRLFQREGLVLPLRLSSAKFQGAEVEYISLKTWFDYLLDKRPTFMLGGFTLESSSMLLQNFWMNFESNFPQHDIFDIHPNDLSHCIPYYLHLDEGVGLRKSGVLIISMQCIWGLDTRVRFSGRTELDLEEHMTNSQTSNQKRSSFLTRFLYTIMPKKVYQGSAKNPMHHVYDGVMENLAEECGRLAQTGITVKDAVYYPICLGMKGDQPALISNGKFDRSFRNLGVNKGCCWECCAGYKDFPFEDVEPKAAWCQTVGVADPWTNDRCSPFLEVPSYKPSKHLFWKRDPFHAFKQSIGGHFLASSLILLAVDFGVWRLQGQSYEVGALLERAYFDFEWWVKHQWRGKVRNNLKSFTKMTLHFPDKGSFPYMRPKGSDLMLALRWLREVVLHGPVFDSSIMRDAGGLLLNPPEAWHLPFLRAILAGCDSSLKFFHILHTEGIWLSKDCAGQMADHNLKFCQAYAFLAARCVENRLPRFRLEPCLHQFRHFYDDLTGVLSAGARVALNPSVHCCEMDEDFVGALARMSRHVHAGNTTRRTIQRYLLKCHVMFQKA